MSYLLPKEKIIVRFYLERFLFRVYNLFKQQNTDIQKSKKIYKILKEDLHLLKIVIVAFFRQKLSVFSSKKYFLDASTLSLLLIKYLDLDIINMLPQNNSKESDAHYKATRYYLKSYLLEEQEILYTNDIDKIEGYLQAFQSLCEVQDFNRASKLMNLFLETKTHLSLQSLYIVLINWGYEKRANILYSKLWKYSDINDEYSYFITLGNLFISLLKLKEGINCYEKALRIIQKRRKKNKIEISSEISCLNLLGQTHTILAEYQPAIEYHSKALNIIVKNKKKSEFWNKFWEKHSSFRSIFLLSSVVAMCVLFMLANPVLIQIFIPMLILLINSIPQSIGLSENPLADTLNQLGNIYLKMEDYQTAIEFYDKSLKEASSNKKNTHELIDSLCNIGNVYLLIKDGQNSIIYYQKALQISKNRKIWNRPTIEGNIFAKLGSAYIIMEDYENAKEKYSEALLCFKKIENKNGEAWVSNLLGNLYFNSGEYHKSITYYQQALLIYQEINNHSNESVVKQNLNIASQHLGQV